MNRENELACNKIPRLGENFGGCQTEREGSGKNEQRGHIGGW